MRLLCGFRMMLAENQPCHIAHLFMIRRVNVTAGIFLGAARRRLRWFLPGGPGGWTRFPRGRNRSAAGVGFVARPLPLAAVRITGGPLKHAQELGIGNLLKLEPGRMMYHLRDLAGLKPKATQGYGSWDGPGRNLTGHIAGHYLSAVSYMYAATGDDRFKQRADYLVDEMGEVQEKRGNGYIGV